MTSYQTFGACRIVKATVNKTLILDTYSIIQHLIFINFISLTVLNGYQQSKLIKCRLILYGIDQNVLFNFRYVMNFPFLHDVTYSFYI